MPPSSPPGTKARAAEENFKAAHAHHTSGRLDRAEALYQKVLRSFPAHADSLNLLGLIALDRGRPERAIQLIRKAVAAAPGFPDAHMNLGNALSASGQNEAAIESYRQAVTLQPRFAAAHSNLARALNLAAAYKEAVVSTGTAIAIDPNLPDPWHQRGIALHALGDLPGAEAAARNAARMRPKDAAIRRELGLILLDMDRPEEAVALLTALANEDPTDAANAEALALTLYQTADLSGALAAYEQAARLAPDRAEVWNGLGRAQRALGRFREAEASFRRSLSVAPDHADAHRNLTLIGAAAPDSAEIARLTEALDAGRLGDMDRVTAGFALGHLLDATGQYQAAFARYSAANALYRTQQAALGHRFDRDALTRQVDALIALGTRDRLSAAGVHGCASELPVFIAGMPRSGTSLVEQIMASHDLVHGAGELRDIGRIAATLGLTVLVPPDDGHWNADQARALAGAHLTRLRQMGGPAARVIDKLPDNVFALGLIAALFPGGRVILCERDARDSSLSAYFTLFSRGNLFSYDLDDCAFRWRETQRLMNHWKDALPMRVYVARYETLIADFENEAESLIRFLGLDWDPACLAFHKTDRPVMTASTWQVRQPLFASSSGRWRNYAGMLDGLDFGVAVPAASGNFTPNSQSGPDGAITH